MNTGFLLAAPGMLEVLIIFFALVILLTPLILLIILRKNKNKGPK